MADGNAPDYGIQHHVYGAKAALTFQANETRAGVATIHIDAANAVATRSYDWANKLVVQVTANEMPIVAATFLGLMPKCEFKNHGEDNTKGYSIERQPANYFVRIWEKGRAFAVPVNFEDGFYIATLLVEQLQKQHAAIKTSTDALNLLRQTVVPNHRTGA